MPFSSLRPLSHSGRFFGSYRRPLTTKFSFLQTYRGLATATTRRHTLNTGAKIPAIGFGTFQDADAQEAAVCIALKTGYRHIDTARVLASYAKVTSPSLTFL